MDVSTPFIPFSRPAFILSNYSITMYTALVLAALVSVAYTAPQPQLMDLNAIAQDYDPPELVSAPINVEMDIPASSTSDAINPLQSVPTKKRDIVTKRDGDCSPYRAGSGPVPNPDTPSAFLSDPEFAVYPCCLIRPQNYCSNIIMIEYGQ